MIKTAMEHLERQKVADKTLQAELEGGDYTFDAPLVVDFYDELPLSTLILFQTETVTQVKMVIV